MKKALLIVLSFIIIFGIIKCWAKETITDESALAAIRNYCYANNPGLKEIESAGEYPVFWEVISSDENEIVVLFRSYTGAEIRYYIDPDSGDTYVTEYVPGITSEEERTDESFNVKEYASENAYDYLILVNKTHKLPEDWESKVILKEAENRYGETYLVEEKALNSFLSLREELLQEGIDIELDSTTRSVEVQQKLWEDWTIEYGEDYVRTYVAVPGYSEHHTGLAIDICLEKDGKRIDDNADMIAEREIFAEIHKHLADHGFILRYLEGKEEITGYGYEPWHFRYINDPELAREIMEKGITLEEYLGELPEAKAGSGNF